MGKGKPYIPIGLISAALLLTLLWVLWAQTGEPLAQVRFTEGEYGQELTPYFDAETGEYFLFLPAHVSPEEVRLSWDDGCQLLLNGGEAPNSLAGLSPDEDFSLTLSGSRGEGTYRFRLLACRNIPTLYLQTRHKGLEYLHQDKGNREDVSVSLVGADGTLLHRDVAKLSGRGNGTWENQAKRSYNLRFSQAVSIGPFEDITTLCLLSEYSDETKMRNCLAYFGGSWMEIPYHSPYDYVDLYVNGEYIGLYGVATKQEYTKYIHRDKLQAVFENASSAAPRQFQAERSDRTYTVYMGSMPAIKERVDALEEALAAKDWEKCSQIADLRSFARKYALDEFFANYDTSYASQYYYLDEHNVIHCMLPWDYDFSMGSSGSYFHSDQVHSLVSHRYTDYVCVQWMQCGDFAAAVREILETEYTDAFLDALKDMARTTAARISASWACDRARWQSSAPFSAHKISSGMETIQEMTDYFCDYFQARRDFLLSYFREPENYQMIQFVMYPGDDVERYINFCVPSQTDLAEYMAGHEMLTEGYYDLKLVGWYTEDGQTPEMAGRVSEGWRFIAKLEKPQRKASASGPGNQAPASLESLLGPDFGKWTLILTLALVSAGLLLTELRRSFWKRKE